MDFTSNSMEQNTTVALEPYIANHRFRIVHKLNLDIYHGLLNHYNLLSSVSPFARALRVIFLPLLQ